MPNSKTADKAETKSDKSESKSPARSEQQHNGSERSLTGSLSKAAAAPVSVGKTLVDDVAGAARRPDALLYWGGLAGLAALGAIEWPVAAVVGVGVAVARSGSKPASE